LITVGGRLLLLLSSVPSLSLLQLHLLSSLLFSLFLWLVRQKKERRLSAVGYIVLTHPPVHGLDCLPW
jgi:flagellar biosynthesis component FlhA